MTSECYSIAFHPSEKNGNQCLPEIGRESPPNNAACILKCFVKCYVSLDEEAHSHDALKVKCNCTAVHAYKQVYEDDTKSFQLKQVFILCILLSLLNSMKPSGMKTA